MVTLHSDTLTESREGRASEALDEITTKKDATSTELLHISGLPMYEACPNAEINQCWAKLGSFLGGYSQRRADVAKNHRALAANSAAYQVRTGGESQDRQGPRRCGAAIAAAARGQAWKDRGSRTADGRKIAVVAIALRVKS